ncbi:hypothetical protein BI347_02625 [Chromobacterium sphagni]|uniref:Uncharacterized protein n=1 Tax=Chromobacterium sphagni TaxID=1903179 RepID=A0A1S1WZE2_9NEIS|nr:hypothetical protein [Chromobacterium sphagni]OHX12519.1 hypothetical protein BI347_02625 [Chromobacterium sphagni]
MHLTDPKRNAYLCEQLDICKQLFASYQQAQQDHQSKAELFAKQQQAADDAEQKAKTLRGKARALLREMMGQPSKQMQDLRSEERAAYSEAEDYRTFLAELELDRDEAALAMLDIGRDYVEKRQYALQVYTAGLLDQASQLEPLLKALAMHEDGLLREGQFATWRQLGFESAQAAALSEFNTQLTRRLSSYQYDHHADSVHQVVPWAHGLEEARGLSLCKYNKQKAAFAERRQALEAANQ